MATYDSLHRQCRTLESLFDTKLTSYSRLASTITRPGTDDVEAEGSTARVQDVEQDVQELLEKVRTFESMLLSRAQQYIPWALCSWARRTTTLLTWRVTQRTRHLSLCSELFNGIEMYTRIMFAS